MWQGNKREESVWQEPGEENKRSGKAGTYLGKRSEPGGRKHRASVPKMPGWSSCQEKKTRERVPAVRAWERECLGERVCYSLGKKTRNKNWCGGCVDIKKTKQSVCGG